MLWTTFGNLFAALMRLPYVVRLPVIRKVFCPGVTLMGCREIFPVEVGWWGVCVCQELPCFKASEQSFVLRREGLQSDCWDCSLFVVSGCTNLWSASHWNSSADWMMGQEVCAVGKRWIARLKLLSVWCAWNVVCTVYPLFISFCTKGDACVHVPNWEVLRGPFCSRTPT